MKIEDMKDLMKREFKKIGEDLEIVKVDEGYEKMRINEDEKNMRKGGKV